MQGQAMTRGRKPTTTPGPGYGLHAVGAPGRDAGLTGAAVDCTLVQGQARAGGLATYRALGLPPPCLTPCRSPALQRRYTTALLVETTATRKRGRQGATPVGPRARLCVVQARYHLSQKAGQTTRTSQAQHWTAYIYQLSRFDPAAPVASLLCYAWHARRSDRCARHSHVHQHPAG